MPWPRIPLQKLRRYEWHQRSNVRLASEFVATCLRGRHLHGRRLALATIPLPARQVPRTKMGGRVALG